MIKEIVKGMGFSNKGIYESLKYQAQVFKENAQYGLPMYFWELMKLKEPYLNKNYGIFLKLGSVTFALTSIIPQNITEDINFKIDDIETWGDKPNLKYKRKEPSNMTLSGVVYSQIAGERGSGALADLESEAGEGKPLRLIDAMGTVYGYWFVTSIRIDKTEFSEDSKAKKMNFTISLKFDGMEAPEKEPNVYKNDAGMRKSNDVA